MSEYADIVIGKLSLCWFRNYLNNEMISLFFSKNDLVITHDCKIDDDDEDAGNKRNYLVMNYINYSLKLAGQRRIKQHNL
ncbi:MAG: hypothetical protein HFG30_03855 [Eubacterium sp.]|jgi:hypothetical protein|nr:hypothetical protein [Eubacterium sp.]